MLIHRCTRCGRLRLNRTAADDNVLLLLQLAALPLAAPPVPYARFGVGETGPANVSRDPSTG